MTSRKKSGSSSSSGKRKSPKRPRPPKPPLPEEDSKLAYVLSSSPTAAGEIARGIDQPPYPDSGPREGYSESSRHQSGSSSPSGKRKAPRQPKSPKPLLLEEDPKLAHTFIYSKGGTVFVADRAQTSKSQSRKKRKTTRYVIAWGLGLISLAIALYFLLQYFLR